MSWIFFQISQSIFFSCSSAADIKHHVNPLCIPKAEFNKHSEGWNESFEVHLPQYFSSLVGKKI